MPSNRGNICIIKSNLRKYQSNLLKTILPKVKTNLAFDYVTKKTSLNNLTTSLSSRSTQFFLIIKSIPFN